MTHSYDDRPDTDQPLSDGMSWAFLAYHMRLYGKDFVPPPRYRGLSLSEVEARAREEGRAEREATEARESAARIDNAPSAIERALLDTPPVSRALSSRTSSASKPAPRGWRQRVRFLNHLRRCRTQREAAARVGVDESTVRRWRRKFPTFGARFEEIVAERHRENCDDLRLRAGQATSRPCFFRGRQIGEHVVHDDRALIYLIKLDEAARCRAEAREERREQRAHELRMRELEIAARQVEQARPPIPEMPACTAHSASPPDSESLREINDLDPVEADIAPPQVVEVANEGECGDEHRIGCRRTSV